MKEKRHTLLFWAFLACAVLRFLAVIPFVIDDDEAWWAVSARWLKLPWNFYRSVPDDKTPGSVWFGWGVRHLFGFLGALAADPRVIRAAFTALTIVCALLLGKIAVLIHDKSAQRSEKPSESLFWLTALLFLIATTLPSPKLLAFTGDGLMALLAIAGYALALLGNGIPSYFLAGALLGSGLLVKQTAVFTALPILFSRTPKKWSAADIVWILLGSLSVLIPSIWALGPQEMFYWVWTYPKEVLTVVRGEAFSWRSEFLSNAIVFILALLPLSLAAFRLRAKNLGLFDFRIQWLLSGLLVILAGKGLFLHYFLMIAPALALLLADVYSKKAFRLWEGIWLGGGYFACCVLVTIPALQVSWGTDLPYFSRLQSAIAPTLTPQSSILVWGGSALPLAYSGMRPVTRFVLPRYAVAPYGTDRLHEIFLQELQKDPPELVIDLHERGDNRFGNPLESEPAIADLVQHYHLYVAPGVPWAKLYYRTAPSHEAQLVKIKSPAMKEQVYASYPSVNPAWKPFEKLIDQKVSFSTLNEVKELESSLRTEHALELIALHSFETKKRSHALLLAKKIRDASTSAQRSLASVEANRFLAQSKDQREVLPLNTPEWWFTVSLAQMQPRVTPQHQEQQEQQAQHANQAHQARKALQ
jgi:hypothetical protein